MLGISYFSKKYTTFAAPFVRISLKMQIKRFDFQRIKYIFRAKSKE